jgi:hypothetical protein
MPASSGSREVPLVKKPVLKRFCDQPLLLQLPDPGDLLVRQAPVGLGRLQLQQPPAAGAALSPESSGVITVAST